MLDFLIGDAPTCDRDCRQVRECDMRCAGAARDDMRGGMQMLAYLMVAVVIVGILLIGVYLPPYPVWVVR